MNLECNNKTSDRIVDNQRTRRAYRRRLVRLAAMLAGAIVLLVSIQWEIGTKGWDLFAGLLTIVMVVLGFGLVAVLLRILRDRLLGDEDFPRDRYGNKKRFPNKDWMEELHRNDPGYLGSPYYRSLLDD